MLAAVALTATTTDAWALKSWTGQGDGTSWIDGDNWNGNTVPAPGDEVLLDNLNREASYTVQLPAGLVSTSITRLVIRPAPARTITLLLPATNTANPGFRVGDDVASTEDIVLGAGAVLRNASAATFGNGIEVRSLANGSVRIENGARYVHNSARSASGVAPYLSAAAGTESGEFEYDAPGTATVNIAAAGRTYGSLTLRRSSGPAAYGAIGNAPLTIRGALRLGTGVTLSSTMTGTLVLGGNVVNDGAPLALPAGQPVVWNGAASQSISGSGSFRFYGPGTIESGATVAVGATTFGNENTLTVRGTLRLDAGASPTGAGTYTYDPATGVLVFNGGGSTIGAGASFWPAASGPARVRVLAGGVTLQVPRTVADSVDAGAPIGNAELLTVQGTLVVRAAGLLSAAPTYGPAATLVYATAGAVGAEWSAGATPGVGVPLHVVVRADAGVLAMPGTAREVPGNLAVESGALRFTLGQGGLTLRGNLTSLVAAPVQLGAVDVAGGAVQQVSGPLGLTLEYLRVAKNGGAVQLASTLALSAPRGGAGLAMNGTLDELSLNGRALAINGGMNGTNPNGTVRGGSGSSLSVTGSGALGTFRFAAGANLLQNLSVFGNGRLVVQGAVTVEGTLHLNGTVAADTVRMGIDGVVVRSGGQVDGALSKEVELGATALAFEVGTASGYAPMSLLFGNVSVGGRITVRTVAGDHPQLAGSGLDPTATVNRYWIVDGPGVVFDSCSATWQFGPGDLDPGTNPATLVARRRSGGSWSSTRTGTRTSMWIEALGLTGFGEFAIGADEPQLLTVSVVGSGSVARSPDLAGYPYGTQVTLEALTAPEYHFDHWSGAVSGSQNPVALVMDGDKAVTAHFVLNATVQWTGQGDGISWSDGGNWSAGVAPGPVDEVFLDHTHQAAAYTVRLPAGSTGVQIKRLGIDPGGGPAITLEVPATNTADPGLQVGDGFATTDDIVLGAGGVLRNASGAAGAGVTVDANGVVRINDGGRYVHATLGSPNGVALHLSTLASTAAGEFEYDVPGVAPAAVAAAGIQYGYLTLTRSAGAATYTLAGAMPLRVRGRLKANAGVTCTSTMTAALELGGNLQNSGTMLVIPAGQTLRFIGTSPQSLYGTGGLRILGTAEIPAGAEVVVGTAPFQNDGTVAVAGTLTLAAAPSGAGSYAYDPTSGTLVTTGGLTVSGAGGFWPVTNGPSRVHILNGSLNLQAPRTVVTSIQVAAPLMNAGQLTSLGTLTLQSMGLLEAPPTFGSQSTLVYEASGAIGTEWLEGGYPGVGVPRHVVVRATLDMPAVSREVPGDLTIESGALRFGVELDEIAVRGNFTTLVAEPIQAGAIDLIGSAVQQVSGPMGFTLEYLRMAKSGGAVQLGSDLTVSAPRGGAGLEMNGTVDELSLNGHALVLAGGKNGTNGNATVRGASGSGLSVTGGGALGTFRFPAGGNVLDDLGVSGGGTMVVQGAPTIEGTLTLGGAVAADTVKLAPGGNVVRYGGQVNGALRKRVSPGSGTVAFEVGVSGTYAPVTLQFGTVSAAGDVTVRTVTGDHPQLPGSILDPNKTVNRHWHVAGDGVAFDTYQATFQFVPADVDTATDPLAFVARRRSGGSWSTTTAGLRTPTTTQALGVPGFGEFAVGAIQAYPLIAVAERNDRYAVEVSFPGPNGTRIIVDAQDDPLLGNIDPAAIPGRTISIYRSGQVELPAVPSSVSGGEGPGLDRSPPPISTQQLHADLFQAPATFELYASGTLMPSWGDFDNDGDLDLPLYRNDGNHVFTEIPGVRAHLANGNYHGSSWCDFDQDGDLDLVITGYNLDTSTNFRTLVLRNDDGVFVNIAPGQGMDVRGRGEGALFGDFDGDGKPDLYIPYHDHQVKGLPDSSLYYRNNGGGSFSEVSWIAGLGMASAEVPAKPEGVDAADFDDDGDLDIYTASHLFVNNGTGTFGNLRVMYGLPLNFDEGACFVDYDNDGDFDLYTKNGDSAHLFRYDGGTVFVDVTSAAGIATSSFLWGDSWADVDNDGDLDLLQYLRNESARLMENQGDGTFVLDPAITALDLIGGMSSWGDYDNDGDLDLVEGASQAWPYRLLENRLQGQGGFEGSYLKVRVLDENGNMSQHRATVKLRTVNGPPGVAQARAVGGGVTYLAQNDYIVHFGLGVHGSVARSPDLPEYASGTAVQLTAEPASGYHFIGWTGDATGAANPITVTVDQALDVRAVFEVNTYTLSTGSTGGGTVVRSPDQATYVHGSRVQLTAQPAAGYRFVGWSGDASGTMPTVQVLMDAPKSVTAQFVLEEYALTVTTTGNGAVTKTPDLPAYTHGTTVQLAAVPAANHHLVAWGGDASGAASPLGVLMDRAKAVTATFGIDSFPLTVTVAGNGAVARSPDQPAYAYGTSVQLTATPAPNHHFVGWSGAASGTTSPIAVLVDQAKAVTATFAIDTRTLALSATGHGAVAKNPDQAAYDHGSVVTLTATPEPGHAFVGWSGDASGTQNPLALTMDANKTVVARFTHTVTVTVSGSGTVARNPDQAAYAPGTVVTLTATASPGHHFTGWSGDASGTTNPLPLTVDGDESVVASFAIDMHPLNVTVVGSGSVTRAPNAATYAHGTSVTLNATPASNWQFTSWSGDLSGNTTPTTILMDGPKNVTATFTAISYTLDVTTIGNGTVVKSPDQPSYSPGTNVTLTATPAAGYRLQSWSGDATGTTNPLVVTMNANKSITATFDLRPLKVWVGAAGGGDGATWADTRNWNESTAPASTDTVLLDNVTVAGNYGVTLPAGAVTVTVARLRVEPAAGRTITLTLPATNTANPGLRIGDGVAGTNDVVLKDGAVLRNASGAGAGTGLELSSTANGLLRIENGAHYQHATLRSATAIAGRLVAAPETRLGEFVYDVPGAASFAIAASGITYGSLTLSRAQNATYIAAGSSALSIQGDLGITSNVTYNSTMTGPLLLGGSLTNDGQNLTLPSSQATTFNGTTPQIVSGLSSTTLSGASTIAAGATVAFTTGNFSNNATMTILGALRIDDGGSPAGTGTYTYNAATGTLVFNTSTNLQISSVAYWPLTNGPQNVTVLPGGGIRMNINRTVGGLFETAALVTSANRLTLTGILRMKDGASCPNAPGYSGTPTLEYLAGATVGNEWASGATVGSGVPMHVVVDADQGTVQMPNSDRNVPGNLTLQSGTLALGATSGNLLVHGNAAIEGTLQQNGRAFVMSGGAATQTLAGASLALQSLRLAKSAGTVQLLADLSCAPPSGLGLEFAGTSDVLDLNGRTLTLSGTVGGSNVAGTIRGSATSSLVLNGAGAMGTLRFTAGFRALQNLTLNRTASGSATLGTPLTVNGTLALTNGALVSGANLLTLSPGGTVTRANGFVSGLLRKTVPTGAASLGFELGSGTTYAPLDVAFGNVTTSGTLTASTTAGDHPNIAGSGLDPALTANRYWTLANGGIAFNTYAATLHFAAADLDAGANPDDFTIRRFSAANWTPQLVGTRTATSTQMTGATGFGDFVLGDVQLYSLTVDTLGHGAVTKSPNQALHESGSSVTLTATPAPGHAFVGWSGDAGGTTNPLTVLMDANKSITAVFTFALDVQSAGNGTVSKSPNQAAYAPGTVVTVTATPATGYHFTGWSGDTTGTTNPLAVTVTRDKSLTGTFTINTYSLGVSVVGNGNVTKVPNQPTYDHGTNVTLTATPAAGWHFVSWGGDLSGSTNPTSVTMTANKNVTATFAINTYTLDVAVVGAGTVTKVPNQPTYDHGTSVTLTATPAVGWHFVGWSGDLTGATNPASVTMTSNKSVTATFAINTYTLAVNATGSGAMSKSPDQPTYDHGTRVTITAIPAPHWHFVSWGGDTSGTTNPTTITMTSNKKITVGFAIDTHVLSVATVGSGTVAKSPDQSAYDYGTVVTLTPTPAAGWHFEGWSGDLSGNASPATVAMTANQSVTATFAINTYTLDVTSSGAGGVTKSPDQAAYDHGTTVTLTATPAAGWHFVSWGGDLGGTTNPASLAMTSNKSVTATFAINTYTLGVSVAGSGNVTKVPNQPTYDHGTNVTLTAAPAAGWHLVSWGGDLSGSTNPTSVTMTSNKSVTATFAINTYTLDVAIVGAGSVTKIPNQPTYDHGTSVTLTATPAVGWHFVGWSGDLTGATNPASVTMTSNKNVTATFAINTYTLAVNSTGSGAVSKSPDQPTYEHGTRVTLTAVPAPHWHFVGWGGDTSGTTNPTIITMTSNKKITVGFAIDTHELSVATVGSGTVTKSPDQAAYDYGTVVTLTPTPAAGWHFVGWSGDLSGNASPATVAMTANQSVTATFAINTYTLNVTSAGAGSVTKTPDQGAYDHGTTVTLTATPAAGWHFTGWGGDLSGTTNPASLAMTSNKDVTATFAINTYTLGVTIVGSGTVAKSPDLALYDHGTEVTLTATPAEGWRFEGWSGDLSGTTNPTSLAMTSHKDVTATFTPISYTLDVTVTGQGTVAKSPDQTAYDHGTTVTLTASPAAGWHFVGWSGDLSGANSPATLVMTADRVVTATFAINTYPLTVNVLGNGDVTKTPDEAAYGHGTVVTLNAMPQPGHAFLGWSGDASGNQNPLQVTMDQARNISAQFTYALAVTTVGAGAVQRDPDLFAYTPATEVALTATPSTGWHFVAWSGTANDAVNPTTVSMDEDRAVTATFAIDQHTLATSVIGSGTVLRQPDQATYPYGSTVSLTASPATGWHFTGWSGDASGTIPTVDVVMNGDRTVTASFAINTYTLTLASTGNGSVAPSPNQPAYDHGTVVTLTATPAPHWHLEGWSGDASGTTNPVALVMDGPKSVDATFAINTYPLEVTAQGQGTVTRTPDQLAYAYGTSVTLSATPASGWFFSGWSGDVDTTAAEVVVLMEGPRAVVATFEPIVYPLTVNVTGSGAVLRSPDQQTYAEGTVVTLDAVPAAGWHFVGWGGDASGNTDPLVITMDGEKTINVLFQIDVHTLTVTTSGRGVVTRSPNQSSYQHGTSVTLSAVPDSGWRFTGWSGDLTGMANPVTLVMNASKIVAASFADTARPIAQVHSPNGGEVAPIGGTLAIQWKAQDNHKITSIDLALSRDGRLGPYQTLATGLDPTPGSWTWTVSGPASTNAFVRVVARDSSGNVAADTSDAAFSIRDGTLDAGDPALAFALEPIVPNPARGEVTLEYAVARTCAVSLDVLDLQGRQVAALVSGVRDAGLHRVAWDPRELSTAPGTYFVRYRAAGRTIVRRLTVTR